MTELLPSLQAERIRRGLVDYLTTTFALADAEPRRALAEFLEDEEHGIFSGPYARLRVPYRPAADDWQTALDWRPPFPPYRHQAEAFRRLTTKDLDADRPRPEPTIVTTGTGSGKTEAFLYPILDHVVRARREGVSGTKAIVLYPMNALASDQADRLAALITGDPALARVTAALYTGDAGSQARTTVTAEGLITSRTVIREDPPDIILTNYKMLDQLLLRPADQGIWAKSALSLTYLVLDEFHTYDGAQGTDVAMLLRRLGLALRAHTPRDHPDRAQFDIRPLGRVTPVATSATLGDGGDVGAVLSFAEDVFGEPFPRGSAVTEQRVDVEGWADAARKRVEKAGLRTLLLASFVSADIDDLEAIGHSRAGDGEALTRAVCRLLYRGDPDSAEVSTSDLLRAHPDVRRLIEMSAAAVPLTDLAEELFPAAAVEGRSVSARRALAAVLAALSHLRATGGRDEVGVEITLWLREVSRVDRALSSEPGFRWSDDGDLTDAADGGTLPDLPAAYCRSCGRSGWMAKLAPTGSTLADDDAVIRRDHLGGAGRVRMLVHAPGEDLVAGSGEPVSDRLRWYQVDRREIMSRRPGDDDMDRAAGLVVPVLMLDGADADTASRRDECPSCGRPDSIRFLGSAIATLLSVTLSILFGDPDLDLREKRVLVFTDSVQDAAHRAGFVATRSHAMSFRAALRSVLVGPTDLETWVDAALEAATEDPFARFRLVPSDVLDHEAFAPFWQVRGDRRPSRKAVAAMRRRMLLDVALEVGLQSSFGRTLESTGSVWSQVDIGDRGRILELARNALSEDATASLDGVVPHRDHDLVRWVRGIVEHLRRDGAIDHEWFDAYKRDDGARFRIWGGRRRDQGMPAFPAGRSAPAYAVVGGGRRPEHDGLAPIAAAQGWYARWTAKNLHVAGPHAASLAVRLVRSLADAGILSSVSTTTGATVHGIPASAVLVGPLLGDETRPTRLVCDTCHVPLPTSPEVGEQLVDGPCFAARCAGRLVADDTDRDSFYRRLYATSEMRRVDAHEHSSLLESAERRAAESGFKRAQQDPGDPNVLVATPTLEMGIDIGDLSTVMLSSLPDSVAKYVQRVGRAGRLSGSSLALAYVTGRGEQLPRIGDPGSLINGPVRPPATYLEAEEILRRQFIAAVIDGIARERPEVIPSKADAALGSAEPGTLLGEVVDRVRKDGRRLVEEFAGTFPDPAAPVLRGLMAWAVPDEASGDAAVNSFAATVFAASIAYSQELEALQHQRKEVDAALADLKQRADAPAASEDDRRAYRSAITAIKLIRKLIDDLRSAPWISGLEARGLLPTYSLVDDAVRLDAQVSWIDADTRRYKAEPVAIDRSASRALRELAPGAYFYARGLEIRVDGIDVSANDELRTWLMCPVCGFVQDLGELGVHAVSVCPRCGSPDIADTGQRVQTARLTRVFSDIRRDDARIGDARDERRRTQFEVVPSVDLDPGRRVLEWSVPDVGLGLAQYRALPIRWVNFGQGQGAEQFVAGHVVGAAGFRLCEACGKLDRDSGRQSRHEHRAWCRHRDAAEEHTRTLALTRELVTEATAVVLPRSVTSDSFGAPSLAAAMMLGLRETLGGAPAHLDIMRVPYPVRDGGDGEVRDALLLHDTVPGGTGYLADLSSPAWLWRLLVTTAQLLHTCECQDEGRACCHRCLLPFSRGSSGVVRSVAARALEVLLEVQEGESLAELEPEVVRWSVAHEPVAKGSGESSLEQKFRAAFLDRARSIATVKEEPTSSGIRLKITGLGRRVWTLTPQVLVHGTKPDFVLESSGAKPVAIYVDGFAYHASPAVNRLRDDTEKRASLRAQGYHVVAVTNADLEGQAEPAWLDATAVGQLLALPAGTPGAGMTSGVVDELAAGPLGLLAGYMQEPDSVPRARLGEALPLLLRKASTLLELDPNSSVDRLASLLARGEPASTAGTADSVLAYTAEHLALATQFAGSTLGSICLVLDDSAVAVAQPTFKSAWRDWLRMSNTLGFAETPVTISTISVSGAGTTTPASTLTTLDVIWSGVEMDYASALEKALATEMTRIGVPTPTTSFDEIDGVPITFSWSTDVRVVVLTDPSAEDRVALEDWVVIDLSDDIASVAETVRAALSKGKT